MNQSYNAWSANTTDHNESISFSEIYSEPTSNRYSANHSYYENVQQNPEMHNTHISTKQEHDDSNTTNEQNILNAITQTNIQELKGTRITSSNIFCKGYGLIPKHAMQDSHMSLTAKAIYSYFCALSGNGKTTFPSVTKICSVLNIGKDAYYNNRKQLIEAGYITVKQQHKGRNFTSNLYTLNPYPAQLLKQQGNEKEKRAAKAVRESGLRNAGYGLLPRSVMTNPNLNAKAKGLYAYFASFAGTGNIVFPSLKRILLDLNISEPTYYKCLNQLKKNGLLSVKQCKKGTQFDKNIYTLNDNTYTDQKASSEYSKEKNIPNHEPQTDKKINKTIPVEENILHNDTSDNILPLHSTTKLNKQTEKYHQPYRGKMDDIFLNSTNNNPEAKYPYTKNPHTSNNRVYANNNSLSIYRSINYTSTQKRPFNRKEYIEDLKDAVNYEDIPIMYPKTDMTIIDSILEMIASVVCFGTEPIIKIGKMHYPREQAKERYLNLTGDHLQYVIECVEKQKHHIRNIRSYYLVSLWNAPDTIDLYYRQRVAEDLRIAGFN